MREIFEGLYQSIKQTAREFTKDNSGAKICSIVTASIIVIYLAIIAIYGFKTFASSPSRIEILLDMVIVLVMVVLIMAIHYFNKRYISWVK